MKWIGPYKIDELLDNSITSSLPFPPEENGVYIISEKLWYNNPSKECIPIYVGSNTGKSKRFRTRIGDLIADIFGFYGTETGHHSGAQSIHEYCKSKKINPKQLFIGWAENCACFRCAEYELFNILKPSLNKVSPRKCSKHLKILN